MRESTALGSAIMAGQALGLFGWDVTKPATLDQVNVKGQKVFSAKWDDAERAKRYRGWERAVGRAKGWNEDEQPEPDAAPKLLS
jgi:glycerol kinase